MRFVKMKPSNATSVVLSGTSLTLSWKVSKNTTNRPIMCSTTSSTFSILKGRKNEPIADSKNL
jgi:hypothetical protein